MKKSYLSLSLAVLLSTLGASGLRAQENNRKFAFSAEAGVRVAAGMAGGGISAWAYRGIGSKQKFMVGLGIRQTSHFSRDLEYITAPAEFTSDEKNLDTMKLSSGSIHSVNLAIDLRYRFSNAFSVGFNIDAIGISSGPEQTGNLKSLNSSGISQSFSTKAKVTSLNALLVGDNDIGTLNSELYVAYGFNDQWAAKLSASYLFTEYTTDKKYIDGIDNDRYRNKSMGLAIALQYRF
jgi:hypothetical protein